MAIQRWDPVGEMVQLKERMNNLFEEILSRSASRGEPMAIGEGWNPPMDLHEEPGRYVVRVDLPGVSATDLELAVEKGMLILRGERRMDPVVPPESYLRVERPHGRFSAQVALPPSVEQQAIEAVHRAGVIEVVLPKRKTEKGPGQIKVKPE